MTSIAKSAALFAFSFAVLLTNDSLAQSKLVKLIEETELFFETESHESNVYETVTVHRSGPQRVFVSNPTAMAEATQLYPTAYPTGIESPARPLDRTYSQLSVPLASTMQLTTLPMLHQRSIQSSVTSLPTGPHGFPIGYGPNDVGYAGPGDMRTHLWQDHSVDLQANGISEATLMSMSMAAVQQWHNYFHGTEAAPSH